MNASKGLLILVLSLLNLGYKAWAEVTDTAAHLDFSTWRLDRSWTDEYEITKKYWVLKFANVVVTYSHVHKETDRKSGQIVKDYSSTEQNLIPLFDSDLQTGLIRIYALNAVGKEVFSLFMVDDKCLKFRTDIPKDQDDCFSREDLINPCSLEPSFHLTYQGNYEIALGEFVRNGGDQKKGLVNFGNPISRFRQPLSMKETILNRFPARAYKDFSNDRAHRLEMGYKFALSASEFPLTNCQLQVSQYEYKYDSDPAKNVHHHLLAGGEDVHSAGAIFFFHDGQNLEKIFVTNRSSRFCPSFESLRVVKKILMLAGIDESLIQLEDGSRNGCAK